MDQGYGPFVKQSFSISPFYLGFFPERSLFVAGDSSPFR